MSKRLYASERERKAAEMRRYVDRHRESFYERMNKWKARDREALANWYVAKLVAKAAGIPQSRVPMALIEAKRAQMLVVRTIKEMAP